LSGTMLASANIAKRDDAHDRRDNQGVTFSTVPAG